MTQPISFPGPPGSGEPSGPRPSVRRRRLLLVGAAAAALALVGGVAGGIAAVVSRSSSSRAADVPGVGGATLFFPSGAGQVGPPSQGGSGAAPYAAPQGAAMGAPAVAGATSLSADGVYGMAVPVSPGGGGYGYPYWGGCNAPGEAQLQGDGITATGMAEIPLSSNSSAPGPTTMNVGVQSNGSGSVKDALTDARNRLAAIRDAAHRAGVPDSDISQQSLNVWANGGPKVESTNVNGNLSITIDDPTLIDRVVSAVIDAGASNLNLWSSNGSSAPSPTDAQVRSAMTKATAAARSIAQAEAAGAGLTLGSLRALVAQPPSLCGWGPTGPQLVAAVTVTYAVK